MKMVMQYGIGAVDEGLRLILARIEDLCDRAARGDVAFSPFLTPREAMYVARSLASRLSVGTAILWGGYAGAERVRAVILPDYVEGLLNPETLSADPAATLADTGFGELAEAVREAVCVLCVRGSGYRVLSHRDYLGSILGLGIQRDSVGDIVVEDADATAGESYRAYVVTDNRMGTFLLSSLERVATDVVQVSRLPVGETILLMRRTCPIRDTVASERLDCVVAALGNMSRDKAQTAIRSGLCELDYELCIDCARTVVPPCVISVRGIGKFSVEAFDGETRKGRMRLRAGKYI